jgi:sigma-B regulation protein RsbU (phosphoserine phosphatase)
MSLLDDTPRLANCITITEATILEVTEELFERLVEESPAVAYAVMLRILETARGIDKDAIKELKTKNEALEEAYAELSAAQEELVEKERLERELEVAADVQRSLLPGELPEYPGYAFAAYLRPARLVGGDFYDVMHLDDEHVGLLMADVADKGFHAALFMAMTRALFSQEGRHTLSPSHAALGVHQGMIDVASDNDMFVTAFYSVLHRPSRRLTYVRAGHDRPLLYRPGTAVQPLAGKGRFLGMLEELELEEYTIQLLPGDRLLLYSDGVPDSINSHGEHYGNQRLAQALEAAGGFSARGIVEHIAAEVADWCRDAPPFDDLTLLVAEVFEED